MLRLADLDVRISENRMLYRDDPRLALKPRIIGSGAPAEALARSEVSGFPIIEDPCHIGKVVITGIA